jgi:hypothetical protein
MMLNLHALTRITQICTLLSLLSGCYNSMYGIPQQEWVHLSEQQKKAVMDDYYAQQRVQQYNQYNAAPNYYPAPVYPTAPNIYYAPQSVVVPVPVYVSPGHPRYAEQQRLREAERRASEIQAREEFNRHAREEARRHEHPSTYQPHAPIHTNPRPAPTHNNRGDDTPRLPHNTAPSRAIHTPPPAHNITLPCRGDCKRIAH